MDHRLTPTNIAVRDKKRGAMGKSLSPFPSPSFWMVKNLIITKNSPYLLIRRGSIQWRRTTRSHIGRVFNKESGFFRWTGWAFFPATP